MSNNSSVAKRKRDRKEETKAREPKDNYQDLTLEFCENHHVLSPSLEGKNSSAPKHLGNFTCKKNIELFKANKERVFKDVHELK